MQHFGVKIIGILQIQHFHFLMMSQFSTLCPNPYPIPKNDVFLLKVQVNQLSIDFGQKFYGYLKITDHSDVFRECKFFLPPPWFQNFKWRLRAILFRIRYFKVIFGISVSKDIKIGDDAIAFPKKKMVNTTCSMMKWLFLSIKKANLSKEYPSNFSLSLKNALKNILRK